MRRSVLTVWLALVAASCGGDGDGGDGVGDDGVDASVGCVPPAATYTAEVRAGKGTCDEDLILDQLLPLDDVVIEEGAMCGSVVVATFELSDECDGTAELSVTLTETEPTGGRLDVVASSCTEGGGECAHAIPVTLEGVRP